MLHILQIFGIRIREFRPVSEQFYRTFGLKSIWDQGGSVLADHGQAGAQRGKPQRIQGKVVQLFIQGYK